MAVSLVAPSITVTLLLPTLATYILFVTGFAAMAMGMLPVVTVVVAFVTPSITVTLSLPWLAT